MDWASIATIVVGIVGIGGITSAVIIYVRFRTAFDGLEVLKTSNEAYLAALKQAIQDKADAENEHLKQVGYLNGQISTLQSSIVDRLVIRLEETMGNAIKEGYRRGRAERPPDEQ